MDSRAASMYGVYGGVGVAVAAVAITVYGWQFFNWVWLNPKKMEKLLRDQGLKGSSYKLLFGDLKELRDMINKSFKKPINLTDDIVPRVLSFPHHVVTTYGKNCFTWVGPRPVLHITDPTMIREMLGNYEVFQKPRGGNPLGRLLAKGLVDVEGDQWVKHRKIINPAFHVEKLKHMVPAFFASCDEMINKWEKMLTEKSSCEIDVWPDIQTLASDVISRTAFSSSYEQGRKIFELQREQAALIIALTRSIYIPGLQFLPTESNTRIKEIANEVKSLVRGIIDKRMMEMKEGKSSKDDLLGILLDSNFKEIKQHGSNKFGLSVDDVIEECKLFYFAGQETTANLLVWTMVLLGQHRDWQDRARDEVLKVFGDGKPDVHGLSQLKIVNLPVNSYILGNIKKNSITSQPTVYDIIRFGFSTLVVLYLVHLKTRLGKENPYKGIFVTSLTNINMIFLEVLRLYPPAVAMTRMIHKETKLGNITLPAGTFLLLHIMLSHYDPCIWGDDVKEFNPKRFSEGVSKVTKGQTVYFPFGGGPRVCIGQNFAMMEAKTALAMILTRFSFELSKSYTHAPYTVVTLQPQFGAHLVLHKL